MLKINKRTFENQTKNFFYSFFFYSLVWTTIKIIEVKWHRQTTIMSFFNFYVSTIMLWFIFLAAAYAESTGGKKWRKSKKSLKK